MDSCNNETMAKDVLFDGKYDFSGIEKGDIIKYGSYVQNDCNGGALEPIEWIVIHATRGALLVISRYGLDCKKYHSGYADITWAKCPLHDWLNTKFYNRAFSEEEKENIMLVKVSADTNPSYRCVNPGSDTTDNVFLLSVIEAEKYFENNEARVCHPTPYALSRGVYRRGLGDCAWWLRTPGYDLGDASAVFFDGSLGMKIVDGAVRDHHYYHVNTDFLAVRPAMWIARN